MTQLLLLILKALLSKVVGDEFTATCPNLARWLVRRSAKRLTVDRERYEEQWLADLEDRKTPLRKIFFALGILRAAAVLRRESAPVRQTAKKEIVNKDPKSIGRLERLADRALLIGLRLPTPRFLRERMRKRMEERLMYLLEKKFPRGEKK